MYWKLNTVQIKANVKLDQTGKVLSLPCIVIEGQGLLESHLRYLVKHRHKSGSWKEQSVLSVRLFLAYSQANYVDINIVQEMFTEFSDCLFLGTCDEKGNDQSGLRWKPRSSSTAISLINHLTKYSDYLYEVSNGETQLLNPVVPATKEQRMLNLAAYHHKKNRSFLKHTFCNASAYKSIQTSRLVSTSGRVKQQDETNAFPNDVAVKLIQDGFKLKGSISTEPIERRINLKNVLITMLLQYGGLRVSEPFHIYVDDIYSDPDNPNSALIRVHHPENGVAPSWWRNKHHKNRQANRKTFLSMQYGLQDRLTSTKHNYHAGWKSSRFNSFYVYWWPTYIGEIWMTLWRYYLKFQRGTKNPASHPFAFTNQYGEPASLFVYKRAHRNALRSIGEIPSSQTGLNPHGHRHWYCQSLTDNKVDPIIIKKAMHHASIESQIRYQEFSDGKIRHELRKLENIGMNGTSSASSPSMIGFDDVDPMGWFSGATPVFGGE